MRSAVGWLVALGMVVGLSSAAMAAEPQGPATEAELQQLLKDGQYQPLVQKATRVLQLKGDAANGYDRAKVLMLKAEGQLRLKQGMQALDSFAAAVKEAKDPKVVALATATEMLVRKSPGGKFTVRPKGGGKPEIIDILDDAGRKQAFVALYEQEAAAAAPKIKAGESAKIMPAIVDALKLVVRLGALEQVANGSDEKTAAAAKDLGAHAQALMVEAVQGISKEVQQISARANATTRQKDPTTGGYINVKHGLSPVDTRLLRADVNNGDQIAQVAKELSGVTKVTALSGVASDATRVSAEAQRLLDTDWNPGRGNAGKR